MWSLLSLAIDYALPNEMHSLRSVRSWLLLLILRRYFYSGFIVFFNSLRLSFCYISGCNSDMVFFFRRCFCYYWPFLYWTFLITNRGTLVHWTNHYAHIYVCKIENLFWSFWSKIVHFFSTDYLPLFFLSSRPCWVKQKHFGPIAI